MIPTLGCLLPSRKCHFAMENVPFCEEVQYMAKHPPSLRMPSIALECFSGPLHRRLFLALSQQILSSDFQNGDRLPSTRALAKALGISRNTVVSAYDKLAEDGYTNSKVGSGTHIALTLTGMSRPATKPGGRNEGRSQPHRSSPTVSLSCPECDFSGPRWKRSLSFRGSLIRATHTAAYRMVGNSYLGITAGLPVNRQERMQVSHVHPRSL